MNKADRRFAVLQIDKLKFTKSMSQIINSPAALLATCVQIGDDTIALLDSMPAIESARIIFTRVIPNYGVPMTHSL